MPFSHLLASPLLTRLGLALSLALLAVPSAAAQGGYRQTEFESLGLELPVPRDYDALPVQPNEDYIVAQWTEKPNPREKDKARGRTLPRFRIVWIEKLPVVESPDDAPVGLGGSEGPEVEEEIRIDTLGDYLEHEWNDVWQEGSNETEKGQGNFKAYSCDLQPGPENRSKAYKGWAYSYRSDDLTIALIGVCHVDDWKDSAKIWEKMASKLEISEPDSADMEKWEKYYARNEEFIDPEYRMEIRSKLVRGWEADDTENYIYVYSTKNQPLISLIKRRIETIRKEYEVQFPPTAPVEAVSTVRICKDAKEYFAYGGPRGSGGYWNWTTEELVFFDYEDDDGAGSGTADTKVVLYHEAFHQYIYYSVGQLAPHTWFNEGYGDYFSGAVLTGKKVKSIGPNPWRTEAIQHFIKNGQVASLSRLVSMEKAEYYSKGQIYYPQGWSLVYFLRESSKAKKHPVWSQILPKYFNTLKSESIANRDEMPDDPYDPRRAFIEADMREAALDIAFEGVDFAELEEAWEHFTLGLKPPR